MNGLTTPARQADDGRLALEIKLTIEALLLCLAASAGIFVYQNIHSEALLTVGRELVGYWHWVFDYSPGFWQEAIIWPSFFALLGVALRNFTSPRSHAARLLVSAIIVFLGTRYCLWRMFHTLGAPDPLTLTLRILCFAVELILFLNLPFVLFQLICPTNRSAEADRHEQEMIDQRYFPPVDVFIPSYNEPTEILRRTIIACQAIDYPNKEVYLCDDTRRDEVKALCEELGCHYLRRPDNKGAKAGNMNNALKVARGELIAVFDADFLPTKAFLRRTVGFFMDKETGLVQTPQVFYNPDPVQRNLSLLRVMHHEEDLFFRIVQPGRDFFNASICHGTSFVVRRAYVDEIGGFPTETISEDFFTSIKLQSRGYRIKYLNEPLSAGASANSLDGFVIQRMRWAQGTLQVLYSESNPLKISGLSPMQRFLNLAGVTHWIAGAANFVLLLLPIPLLYFDITPMHARATETIHFFLPYYAFYTIMFNWFTIRCRSFFFSDLYGPITALQLVRTTLITIFNPFKAKFSVTKKDQAGKINVSWWLMKPIALFLFFYFIGFAKFTLYSQLLERDSESAAVILSWCVYNVLLLCCAAFACVNLPDSTRHGRLERPEPCNLFVNGKIVRTTLRALHEKEATLEFHCHPALLGLVHGDDIYGELLLSGAPAIPFKVRKMQDRRAEIDLHVEAVPQQRKIFELIYSRDHSWPDEPSAKAA